jgi:uncharacterized phage-associated protein
MHTSVYSCLGYINSSVSSHAIANELITLASSEGMSLPNRQLQLLVFLSHGYSLAIIDRPLYFHNTHAWNWGPVIPKLYKSLQKYRGNFVTDLLKTDDELPANSDEAEIVRAVWESYGHLYGSQLSALTLRADAPWKVTWESNKFGIIPQPLIAAHYKRNIEYHDHNSSFYDLVAYAASKESTGIKESNAEPEPDLFLTLAEHQLFYQIELLNRKLEVSEDIFRIYQYDKFCVSLTTRDQY